MAARRPPEDDSARTEVLLVATEALGDELARELLESPTARAALSAYELRDPYANAIAVETISLGAAITLLNDLDWYLTRYVRDALVRVPSISETEYLSRPLARAIRDGEVDPTATGERLKLYGVERRTPDGEPVAADGADGDGEDSEDGEGPIDGAAGGGDGGAAATDDHGGGAAAAAQEPQNVDVPAGSSWLVEPLFVRRGDAGIPDYDLRPVEDTLVVRITADEFE